MIILGIDPGFAITGFGLIEQVANKFKVIDYGVVTTTADKTLEQRLAILYDRIIEIIIKYKPDCMAVEELFFNKNVKTALSVGHGRGVVLLSAYKSGLEIFEYTPLQVKQAVCGYGRADKHQIQQMVKALLKLESIPKPDDAADALAIAICHANSYSLMSKLLK